MDDWLVWSKGNSLIWWGIPFGWLAPVLLNISIAVVWAWVSMGWLCMCIKRLCFCFVFVFVFLLFLVRICSLTAFYMHWSVRSMINQWNVVPKYVNKALIFPLRIGFISVTLCFLKMNFSKAMSYFVDATVCFVMLAFDLWVCKISAA